MKSLHQKVAHGNGGKIADIQKQFRQKRTRLHENSGYMIQEHGYHGYIFNDISV